MKTRRSIFLLIGLLILLFAVSACGEEEIPAGTGFVGKGYFLRGSYMGKSEGCVVIAEDSGGFTKGTVVVLEKCAELTASFADGATVQFGCDRIMESRPPIVQPLWMRKAGSFSYSLKEAKAAAEEAGFVFEQ